MRSSLSPVSYSVKNGDKGASVTGSALLQRQCACGGASSLTGRCSECEKKKMRGHSLQTKLQINEPGDAYEREADQVAAQVMQMPERAGASPSGQPTSLVQRFVTDAGRSLGEGGSLQRAEATGETPAPVGEQPASDGTAPKDGSADGGGSRCPSWRNDPESISKRAAENYVQHDITPPSQARVEKINCEPPVANGNYGCFVHFSDGLVVRVIVRATDIVVGMGPGQIATETPPPATPLCFYDYHCPDGFLVLTKRECKSAKAATPKGSAGPPAVAQRKAASAATGPMAAPAVVHDVLTAPGQPLDRATRAFFEPRFGVDFGKVRIHADHSASESSRSVNALAYTVGQDIVFRSGQYDPSSHAGRRLLAHELTHVVQQRGATHALQRDPEDEHSLTDGSSSWKDTAQAIWDHPSEELGKRAEKAALDQLDRLANSPSSQSARWSEPGCPSTFCQPFADVNVARAELLWARPVLLEGIKQKVDARVVPLWDTYLKGGSPPMDLTASFGADFQAAGVTSSSAQYLVGGLRRHLEQNPESIPPGTLRAVDFTPQLSAERLDLDRPKGVREMNFFSGIPGNLAGGIGKDQLSNPIGAMASPQNDSRDATIHADLAHHPDGTITVTPSVRFTVMDTVDLCPGHCGGTPEQVATVPLSRFEATALTGDVPFVVEFDAPATALSPFSVQGRVSGQTPAEQEHMIPPMETTEQ